jgi:post-segregation antitoxin (ccd killing protein)
MVRAAKTNTPEAAEPDQRQRWLEENREATDQYNARIERDGLTLRRYRQF